MSRRRLRFRLLVWLTGLFPTWWQERYRAEFTQMLDDLLAHGRPNTLSLMLDIVVGALDAHICAGAMTGRPSPVVRRAAYEGLAGAAVVASVTFVSNTIPALSENSPNPWVGAQVPVVYVGMFVLLMAIGARGARRSNTRYAGSKAGATAGFLIATVALLALFGVDNLFFGIVSQQPEKVAAFATSGQSSMRTFVNLSLVPPALVMIPLATVTGAMLGAVGGLLVRRAPTVPARRDPG